jgi:tetratricopeptide (TPR) repeat protein
MMSSDDPAPQSSATPPPAVAPAVEAKIPLQPVPPGRPAPSAVERLLRKAARLDALSMALLLVLAFFLGSFAAQNSDVWMHLATGRLVAQGAYSFGSDPFAYTTAGVRWVNTHWLSDLLGYAIAKPLGGPESEAGGALLVGLKALLCTALAFVLLQIRRPGQSPWTSIICIALAMLALSPRLLLQPACISFFLLGLTIFLLYRALPESNAEGTASNRPLYLLPVLFALWVNLDSWFWLGPLAVGLFLLGEVLQRLLGPASSARPQPLGALAVVFLVGVGVCLLCNPYHVHVLALPPELQVVFSETPLRGDPHFQEFFHSPLQSAFYNSRQWGVYAGGLGTMALAGLGVISFLLNAASWRWWRVLLWLPFFVLGLYHARAIPFFAVVAAPITALNLYDFAVDRFGAAPRTDSLGRLWLLGGRLATLLGLFALILFDWPGWLHAHSDLAADHRVAWRIAVDPSLRKVSQDLGELRRSGVLQENGFHLNADVPNYTAWFCPEEKGFFDYRFHLFPPEVARTYIETRQRLSQGKFDPVTSIPKGLEDESGIRAVFQDPAHLIDHLVVSASDADAVMRTALPLLFDPSHSWTLLRGDGRATIFGWSPAASSEQAKRFAEHRLNPEQEAFRKEQVPEAAAPALGLRLPHRRNPWEQFVEGPAPHAPSLAEAVLYLDYFAFTAETAAREEAKRRERAILEYRLASGLGHGGLAGQTSNPIAQVLLLFSESYTEGVLNVRGEIANSAPLILAVRAARRAVAENPNDAEAQLTLARALRALRDYQRSFLGIPPRLEMLREIQIVTALENAVMLKPNLQQAHEMLAELYSGMTRPNNPRQRSHLDFWLEHFKEMVRLAREKGPGPGQDREAFDKHIENLQSAVDKNEQGLQQRRSDFELRSKNRSPGERARMALDMGLAQTALEVLEEDRAQLSQADLAELFSLLLRSGRVAAVSELLEAINDAWSKCLVMIAAGDYARADEYLVELANAMERSRTETLFALFRTDVTPPYPAPGFYLQSLQGLGQAAGLTKEWADLLVVRACLALEGGDTEVAERQFRRARSLVFSARQPATLAGLIARGPLASLAALDRQMYAVSGSHLNFTGERLATYYLGQLQRAGRESKVAER